MELVRSPGFMTTLATSVNSNSEPTLSVSPEGLSYNSLGYIVLYDEEQVTTATSGGLDNDFVSFTGPDQWWPWWAWLLFGLALLCCICPLAACIYHFSPGHAGPPSPSGAGGGPGMFGKHGSKGGKDSDVDWDSTQFEKSAGGVAYGDKDEGPFNDAATGISVSFLLLLVLVFVFGFESGPGRGRYVLGVREEYVRDREKKRHDCTQLSQLRRGSGKNTLNGVLRVPS